jgi:6-pyruvoyltetrahydropterin/6-carboxytetrahydropterin synthase
MKSPINYDRFDFFATHSLRVAAWSEEQNMAAFGPCCNANGHGHNFTLEVGYQIRKQDIERTAGNGTLAARVSSYIEKNLHMASLNDFLEGEDHTLPTCEFVLYKVQRELLELFKNTDIVLTSLQLIETRNNAVRVALSH